MSLPKIEDYDGDLLAFQQDVDDYFGRDDEQAIAGAAHDHP